MHTIAVVGAGKIGEVLLSGLLRAGWPAERLLATVRRPERGAELSERYGVRVVDSATAAAQADVLAVSVKPQDAAIIRIVMRYAKPTVVALIRAISLKISVISTTAENDATMLVALEIRFAIQFLIAFPLLRSAMTVT